MAARVDYLTVAEVSQVTWVFTTGTTPTAVDLAVKLTAYHNFIDNNINNRYATPLTDADDIATVKDIVLAFIVDWVYRAKYGFKDIPEAVIANKVEQREILMQIKKGGIDLKNSSQQDTDGLIGYNKNLETAPEADFNTDTSTDDYGKDRY